MLADTTTKSTDELKRHGQQSTGDAIAAKTAIVEIPASKDGVGSTVDCVSQYSPNGHQQQQRQWQRHRTIVDGKRTTVDKKGIAFALCFFRKLNL
jgi:hypothetical protein